VFAQFTLHFLDVRVVVVHDSQQPPEEPRQPAGQPVHRAEVEHAQAPVVEQAEVSRVRVRVQEPGPRRSENRNRTSRIPALSRCSLLPWLMIFDSGVPSIHSDTSTWPAP